MKNKKKLIASNVLLEELMSKQHQNIPVNMKLQYSDLKRICKYIETSIFDVDRCCMWKGYITNVNNSNKGTYINFYYRKKKAALHRLLYANFIGILKQDEYIKFNCENKGYCCNVFHLKKFKYHTKGTTQCPKIRCTHTTKTINILNKYSISDTDCDKLTIHFY